MKRFALTAALAVATLSSAAVKFPYPQANVYDYTSNIVDVWNCAGETASSMLKKQFDAFVKGYYEEQGDVARIRFDEKQYTVSEGIGYGMIFFVYFSDNTKSYQSEFDKLWAYYKQHRNGNGVMDWKIQGFGGPVGQNGATDAEEDVAFALAMAYYQFGDEKYKNDAADLIGKMRQSEFSSDGMHKLGDAWDPYKNPSYVSPAAYEIYKIFDAANSSFWDKAITRNYELLKENANSSTGIPSGWADNNSFQPIVGNNGYNFAGYDYDAVRAPWRWAWSYAWYGHSQAKQLSEKLATWVNSKPFGQLYINMKTDGTADLNSNTCKTNGCKANGSSIGSLTSSLMVNDSYHAKMNDNYQALMSQQQGYFHSSLRLLTGLLMTGNMPNLSKATPHTPPALVIPDSCTAVEEKHQNSGAYGWLSTTGVLTEESATGVHIGELIQGSRDVEKMFDGVTAGNKYTLTLKAALDPGASVFYMTMSVYESETSNTEYCRIGTRLVDGNTTDYSCEFTATSDGPVRMQLVLNNWDDGVTISDVSLKAADGSELVKDEPAEGQTPEAIAGKPLDIANMVVFVRNHVAYVQLPTMETAEVSFMDVQGRMMVSRQIVEHGMLEISLNGLKQGKYFIAVKQGGKNMVRQIVVK